MEEKRMRYKIFGRRTGLRVSELALGAGNFGTRWGHGAERAAAKKVFDSYVEAGGNFIDTADTYQFGESEELVGDFIASDRDYFVLATKCTLGTTPTDGISRTGNSRKNMVRSVEGSLKRLKTDRIDLYWAHFADGVTPMEIAIAWLLHKAAKSTTSLIPILGSRTREQLDATLGALEVKLSSEQVARLDAVSAIPLGTPHEQIAGSAPTMAGGKPELLEVPVIPAA